MRERRRKGPRDKKSRAGLTALWESGDALVLRAQGDEVLHGRGGTTLGNGAEKLASLRSIGGNVNARRVFTVYSDLKRGLAWEKPTAW